MNKFQPGWIYYSVKYVLSITFSLYLPVLLFSQPLVSGIKKYTVNNGLSDNHIRTLFQDSRGYIWIGTEWGLNRYDGRTFKQYIEVGKDQLSHYSINSLAEDSEGNIWVSTQTGVSMLDPFTEKFVNWSRQGYVYSDREKNIWIFHHDSLCLLSGGRVVKKYILDIASPDKNANRYIGDLLEDSHQHLWMTTSFGLRKLDKRTGTITAYTAPFTTNDPNDGTRIYEDEEGDIWAGTWNHGLLKVNEGTHSLENYLLDKPHPNNIYDLHDIRLINNNYLLLASSGGLLIAEKAKQNSPFHIIQKVAEPGNGNKSLQSSFSCVLKDRQGNFWIGSDEGLYKIDISRQPFHWISISEPGQGDLFHSIPDNNFPDSIVYLTSVEGWWRLNMKDLSIHKQLLPEKNRELVLSVNRYVPEKNGLWFTSEKGFGFYDLEKNTITDYSAIIGQGKKITRSWSMLRDHSGKLWIAVFRDGLRIFDPVTGKVEQLFTNSSKEDLTGVTIFSMQIDKEGYIWMTITGKLYRIDPADHSYQVFIIPDPESDPGIRITKDNRILILTDQVIYEWKSGKIERVFPLRNSDLTIDRFSEDNKGSFWLKTHNGFYKLSPDFKKMISYTASTGLDETDMNEMVFYRHNAVILSKAKLLVFNPDQLDQQQVTGPVRITSVSSNRKKYFFPSGANEKIRLDFKDRLEIEVAALNFSNENGNRIFYRLQGWDDEWKELTNGSVVAYEQLPPGNYQFQARANNAGIELMSQPVNLSVGIDPPLWKSGWFITMSIILVTSSIYAIYRYRLSQAIKMERLRTRIATDLHDDIGATLSSISMYSDTVKNQVKEKLPHLETVLEKIGENSRSMVSNMSDIVWAINPGNDGGEKLVYRIEMHARDLCAIKNIHLHFESDEKLNDIKLPLEHRKNIYLVFKEALNNSLKYSCAGNIRIFLYREGNQLVLSIKDDGNGFDTRSVKRGNGLKNMEARAREIKGTIGIVSGEETGTEIILTCTL